MVVWGEGEEFKDSSWISPFVWSGVPSRSGPYLSNHNAPIHSPRAELCNSNWAISDLLLREAEVYAKFLRCSQSKVRSELYSTVHALLLIKMVGSKGQAR